MAVVLGFSRSLRLQAVWAAPRYLPVMWQWSRTESPSRGLSHTWHVSAVRKARQSPRVILRAWGLASTPLILRSSSCSDSKKCSAALGPRYSTEGYVSYNYKPHGVVSVEYCSSWGRAQVLQLWWWEPQSRRRWCKRLAAACGGSERLVCFYVLLASPPDPTALWLVSF